MHLIWKATAEYIHENLRNAKGVNIRGFGAFTFSIDTELPRTANLDPTAGRIEDQRLERMHLHKNLPVFVPDPSFEYLLTRYHRKNPLDKPNSQHSVFQRGFQMVFCNPVPISYACQLSSKVVRDAHTAFFGAIKELAKLGRTLYIKFDFAVMKIAHQTLEVHFSPRFSKSVNQKEYEKTMRKSDAPCVDFWRSSNKWRQSALSTLWSRPNTQAIQEMNQKTLALKVMSLDLASAARPRTAL